MKINEQHLDTFAATVIEYLPPDLASRKEHLVTLLALLPKDYARRTDIRHLLESIHAHERAQMKFQALLKFNGAKI